VEGEPEAAATVVPPAVHGGLPLMFWMDWVPARLLAVSYALVGDFDACLYRWRAALDDRALVAPAVLEDCGNAALHIGYAPAEETRESLISRGAAELESVVVLHRRALLVWLVVIALVSMIG
jgi:membrane protein required for beta-lactamase induction